MVDSHNGPERVHHDPADIHNFPPQYPDPARLSDDPYPVLLQTTNGPFPGGYPVYHSRDASTISLPGHIYGTAPPGQSYTGLSLGSVANDYRALAEQFHLQHGDPGQAHPRNWHLQTGEQIQYMPSHGVHTDSWHEEARAAQARQDAADTDFEPAADSSDDNDNDSDEDDTAANLDDLLEDELGVFDGQPPQASAQGGSGSSSGRGRGSRGGRGRRRGGWRQLLKGTEFENVGRMPRERAQTKAQQQQQQQQQQQDQQHGAVGGPSARRARGRKAVDPGPLFKELQQRASQAYMSRDLDRALDLARQAIQANPEVFQAHSLLSEILRDQGRATDSMTVLWMGAHTVRTPEMWQHVGEKVLRLAGGAGAEHNNAAYLRMAVDCYSEALKLKSQLNDDLEYELRVAKFQLYKELGESKFARTDCRNLLRMWPGEIQLCREYAELCAALADKSELMRAKEAYDIAFEEHLSDETLGDPEDAWSHVNIYFELVDMVGNPAEGVSKLKRFARWILGRKAETFWDRFVEDDREFDNDVSRRGLVPEVQSGRASHDRSKFGDGLPIEIRVKLGLFRLKMGLSYFNEARRHFQPLLMYVEQVEDFYDIFLQTATALRESGYLNEAVEFYDPLRMVPEMLTEATWMVMADCYRTIGKQSEAIECFEQVISFRGPNFAPASSHLAKIYDNIGEGDKARLLWSELIQLGRKDLLSEEQLRLFPDTHLSKLGRRERSTKATKDGIARRASKYADPQQFVPAGEGAFNEFQLNGPGFQQDDDDAAAEDEAEQTAIEQTPKKRGRKKGKKRSLMYTTDNENAGEGGGDEDSQEGGVKRPRLKKAYEPKRQRAADVRRQQMQDAGTRVHANYSIVQMHWAAMLLGENEEAVEQWLEAALSMLDDFAAMKVFFPDRDRNTKLRAVDDGGYVRIVGSTTSTGHAPPLDFHSIPFTEWHRVFIDLALLYARRGEQDKCYKVLQDVLFCANVFYLAPELDQANYGAALCCGLIFNDSQYLIDLARKVITKSDFRSGAAFQLFAAVNRLTYGSNWFNAGPSQKFMLRMVKQLDYMAMPEAAREQFDWSIHKPSLAQRLARLQTQAPHPLDAGVLLMYGHMVAVANHSHSAIPYYFRALALSPHSAVVHLSIATMWVQNSMKRQTDNRHFGIAQGLAALYRYYDLRVADRRADHRQEAEYNVARMWHHLGLAHLAVPAYERVLALSPAVHAERLRDAAAEDEAAAPDAERTVRLDDEGEDFALEAAFALQGLYALAGDDRMARRIGEEWLVM